MNIFTSMTIAGLLATAAWALSSCAAQPAPGPNRQQLEASASQAAGQIRPAPQPEASSPTPSRAPEVAAQELKPGPSQPPPADGVKPAVPRLQSVPAPAVPERRLSPTPAAPNSAGGMISLNFTRADLTEIVHIIAQHLKLTYTIDPEVKGTVTINSAEPMKPEDLLPIFHQVLRMNGAVAVRSGNLYRIVPIKDGKSIARPVGQSREDGFALQIVPVRYFTVAEMKRLLTPFLMPGGEIVENPRGNFLIIMDLPSNIQRLTEIAELIDAQVFAGTRMEIYQPKVASAEELAQEMIKIMQSFAASAPQTETLTAQFIPLPRINQLLVISHSEAAWTYAKRWLDRIDVVAEGPGRRIFIYPVENSKAAELADVLGQALGHPTTTARSSSQTLQSLHRSTTGGTGFGSGGRSTSPTGTTGLSGGQPPGIYATIPVPGQPGTPVPAAPAPLPVPGQPRPPAPAAPGAKPEEQLRIVADPGTNSLIIYGTVQEFQNIRNILKELDAVPRQVLMDVLIAEVTLNSGENLGIDFEIGRGTQSIFDRTFSSRGSVLTGVLGGVPDPIEGAAISRFPGGISGIIGSAQTVRALVNALQSDSRVRILSSPSVLATDNRPARIQVGSEEPIATGQVTSATGASTNLNSSTTIQYRNTGRIVTIVPQVNSQGLVNLQILAEVSQRGANVTVGDGTFPSFDTRQAETTAVVQDGDTLAIGGIITENKSRDRRGIPYLMDIPVFGRFFGSTDEILRRTELVMLITPNVIRNRQESLVVTEEFKSKLGAVRNEIERMKRDQERQLERQKKFPSQSPEPVSPPPDAGKSEPQSPGGAMPEPSAAMPGGRVSPMDPSNPLNRPPEPATTTMPPAPRQPMRPLAPRSPTPKVTPSGDATLMPPVENLNPFSVVSPEEPSPESGLNKTAATAGPAVPNHEIEKLSTGAPPQEQKSRLASAPNPPAIHLAKAKPDVAAKRADATPDKVWMVQVASLVDEEDARTFAEKLKAKGYNTGINPAEVAGRARFRVEIGPFTNLEEAQAVQKELAAAHKLERTLIITRVRDAESSAQSQR